MTPNSDKNQDYLLCGFYNPIAIKPNLVIPVFTAYDRHFIQLIDDEKMVADFSPVNIGHADVPSMFYVYNGRRKYQQIGRSAIYAYIDQYGKIVLLDSFNQMNGILIEQLNSSDLTEYPFWMLDLAHQNNMADLEIDAAKICLERIFDVSGSVAERWAWNGVFSLQTQEKLFQHLIFLKSMRSSADIEYGELGDVDQKNYFCMSRNFEKKYLPVNIFILHYRVCDLMKIAESYPDAKFILVSSEDVDIIRQNATFLAQIRKLLFENLNIREVTMGYSSNKSMKTDENDLGMVKYIFEGTDWSTFDILRLLIAVEMKGFR